MLLDEKFDSEFNSFIYIYIIILFKKIIKYFEQIINHNYQSYILTEFKQNKIVCITI